MGRATDYYDVVILPPAALSRPAIEASQLLAQRFGSHLILDEQQTLPHISLYHVAVERRRAAEFEQTLTRIAERTAPDKLQVTGVHIYREFGSIALTISKPDWLRRLYLKILHRANPLRDRSFDNEHAWGADRLSPAERKFIARYGTPLVGRYFIPHITLAALKDKSRLDAAAVMIKPPRRSFKVDRLHVCLQGEHHTCCQALYAVQLEK